MKLPALLLSSLPLVLTSPITHRTIPSLRKVPFTAKFDQSEQTPNLIQNYINIATAPSLGLDNGLTYTGLTLVNIAPLVTGTRAQSGSNVLAYNIVSEVVNGAHSISAPGDGNAVGFGVESFYFACLVFTSNPVLAKANGCELTVTGIDSKGKTVASATKAFEVGLLDVTEPMLKFGLPKNFSAGQLEQVTFEAKTSGPLGDAVNVVVIDTIQETLYLKK